MKKYIFLTIILVLIIVLSTVLVLQEKDNSEYLRIHIRANSNDLSDQNVKLKVKDAVVDYLTPKLNGIKSQKQAKQIVLNEKENIEQIANVVLSSDGYNYVSNVKIVRENFPTRQYGNLVLTEGNYEAVIVELGEAKGENWWCVVFPPLCFISKSEDIEYHSYILELLNMLKNR